MVDRCPPVIGPALPTGIQALKELHQLRDELESECQAMRRVLECRLGRFGSVAERRAEMAKHKGFFDIYEDFILHLPLHEDDAQHQLPTQQPEPEQTSWGNPSFSNCTFALGNSP